MLTLLKKNYHFLPSFLSVHLAILAILTAYASSSITAEPITSELIVEESIIAESTTQQTKPDLVITNIFTNEDCQMGFSVENRGKGTIRKSIWQQPPALFKVYRNQKEWKIIPITDIDSTMQLKNPGGRVSYISALKINPFKPEQISIYADSHLSIPESNEDNNKRSVSSRCKRPDLVITKLFTNKKCEVMVEIKNFGPGRINPASYDKTSFLNIQINKKKVYSVTFIDLDPSKKMLFPGGYITHNTGIKLTQNKSNVIALIDPNNSLSETNKNNNHKKLVLNCQH